MAECVDILGVRIDRVNMEQAVDRAMAMMEQGRRHVIFTPNSEIIMAAHKDPAFQKLLNSADMRTADGIGVVYAAKILGSALPERVAGFDMAGRILKRLGEKGGSVYLFGSAPGVAQEAGKKMEQLFPGLKIAGENSGYFNEEQEKEIIGSINETKPDLLFVCLGSPKQERWIFQHLESLDVGLAIGLGGTLDVFAGRVQRAPDIFIKLGLEWLYRLLKQPSRIGRMMALPVFILKVVGLRLFGKKGEKK